MTCSATYCIFILAVMRCRSFSLDFFAAGFSGAFDPAVERDRQPRSGTRLNCIKRKKIVKSALVNRQNSRTTHVVSSPLALRVALVIVQGNQYRWGHLVL